MSKKIKKYRKCPALDASWMRDIITDCLHSLLDCTAEVQIILAIVQLHVCRAQIVISSRESTSHLTVTRRRGSAKLSENR